MLFSEQYYDSESDLAYNRFRYYDPKTANYLSPDPIGLQDRETPYAYVYRVDCFGLAVCPNITKDALDRISSAKITISKDMIGTGTSINKSARAFAKSLGNPSDDAGHILDKVLDGQGGKGNVFHSWQV